MNDWVAIRVKIEMGDPEIEALGIFDAYTTGDSWNGWATPYFTREQGERIAHWTEELHRRFPPESVERVFWSNEHKTFVIENPNEPIEPGTDVSVEDLAPVVEREAPLERLYGIGAYRWTWEAIPNT